MITDKIKRWWQGRGFGIESKTDYDFLRSVIKEKTPYYIYKEWEKRYPDATTKDTRLAKLTLRICNSIQPTNAYIYGNATSITREAINNACPTTLIETNEKPYFKLRTLNIKTMIEHGCVIEMIPHDMDSVNNHVAIVITHINSANAPLWEKVANMPIITYDMRDIGIAVMRKGRYPEHYKI